MRVLLYILGALGIFAAGAASVIGFILWACWQKVKDDTSFGD